MIFCVSKLERRWREEDSMETRWCNAMPCCKGNKTGIKRFNRNEKQLRKMLRKIQLNIFPTLLNASMKLHCLSNWPFSSIFDVNGNEEKLLQKLRCFWAFLFESLKLTINCSRVFTVESIWRWEIIAKKKCWHCWRSKIHLKLNRIGGRELKKIITLSFFRIFIGWSNKFEVFFVLHGNVQK